MLWSEQQHKKIKGNVFFFTTYTVPNTACEQPATPPVADGLAVKWTSPLNLWSASAVSNSNAHLGFVFYFFRFKTQLHKIE